MVSQCTSVSDGSGQAELLERLHVVGVARGDFDGLECGMDTRPSGPPLSFDAIRNSVVEVSRRLS